MNDGLSFDDQRRYDLDWLRVGAFLLLIAYHIGMFYVPWGWHVKSEHAPQPAFELPMKLLNGWRLPLLFFISGVVLRFALDKAPHGPFLRRRMWVLWIPLLFGMYVICAPQAWYELRQSGVWSGSVWDFYINYIDWPWSSPPDWPIITPTWNHLWYLLYIIVFTLVLVLLSALTKRRFERALRFERCHPSVLLAVPVVHVALFFLLRDYVGVAQTLYGDWYNLLVTFLITTLGFVLGRDDAFWRCLKDARFMTLCLALATSLAVAALHLADFHWSLQSPLRIIQGWSVIFAAFGWSQILLNRPSAALQYLSGAVFTFYVVHQTVIIVVGMQLSALKIPLKVEVLALVAITTIISWAIYELFARRIGQFGILFGARNN